MPFELLNLLRDSYTEQTFVLPTDNFIGHAVAQWLRRFAARRKVAGSFPDAVTRVFYCLNPSGRTIALGSTQPPTEMNTNGISLGIKAAGA